MATILDILQSTVIGGMILLMVLSFQFRMKVVSEDIFGYNLTQSDVISTSQTIENDFYKIGYNCAGKQKIFSALPQQIKFFADIDNNGVLDTVTYSVSDSLTLLATQNPRDKNLLRKVNTGIQLLVGRVTDFQLSYFDSSGNYLSSAILADSTGRKKIMEVGVYFRTEAASKFEEEYTSAMWSKKIRIKNSL
jgi:hypothetical protein